MIPVRLIAATLILMMAVAPLPPIGAEEGGSPAAHPAPAAPLPASGGWAPLGTAPSPLNAPVRALAVAGADLYVGGEFVNAGSVDGAAGIARWDGQQWHPVGGGLTAPVRALAVAGFDLYAGGDFTDAGGVRNANGIARWDGQQWHPVGGGLTGPVFALAVRGTEVYAGGNFVTAGGDPRANFAAVARAGAGATQVYLPLITREAPTPARSARDAPWAAEQPASTTPAPPPAPRPPRPNP